MKFHQLPLGQSFEYQGRNFIKTSPIIAWCDESDGQQIIPRSAEVRASIPTDTNAPQSQAQIPLDLARRILLESHAYCLNCLRSVTDNPVPDTVAEAERQLVQAQTRFLNELESNRNDNSTEDLSE